MHCDTCHKEYTVLCDQKQGRCPHHKPLIDLEHMTQSVKNFYKRLGYAKNAIGIIGGIILCISNLGVMAFVLGVMLVLAEMLILLEKFD